MPYNDRGEEILDDTPVEVPLHLRNRRPPSIQELIAMHVRAEAQVARAMGENQDEEDFSEEEEFDEVLTPYELHAYAADADLEMRRAEEAQKLIRRQHEKGAGREAGKGEAKPAEAGGTKEVRGKGAEPGEARSQGVGNDRGGEKGAE